MLVVTLKTGATASINSPSQFRLPDKYYHEQARHYHICYLRTSIRLTDKRTRPTKLLKRFSNYPENVPEVSSELGKR